MSTLAAGTYLRQLREGQDLTRPDVIFELRQRFKAQYRLDEKQYWRIEEKGSKSSPALLAAINKILQGSAEDLLDLLGDPSATEEDGMQRAAVWLAKLKAGPELSQSHQEQLQALASSLNDAQVKEALDLIEHLKQNPKIFGRWLGFGAVYHCCVCVRPVCARSPRSHGSERQVLWWWSYRALLQFNFQ